LNIKKEKSRSSSLVEKSTGPPSVLDKSQRKASKSKDDKLVLDNLVATKKNKKSKNKDLEGSSGSKKPKKSKSKKGEKEDTGKPGGPKREKSKSAVSNSGVFNRLQKFGTKSQTKVRKKTKKQKNEKKNFILLNYFYFHR
jgi:hypothetical protein